MSDMKKWIQITEGDLPKETLTEDCNHVEDCSCNSYLCEACYPTKPTTDLKLPKHPEEDLTVNPDGNLSPMSMTAELSETGDDEDGKVPSREHIMADVLKHGPDSEWLYFIKEKDLELLVNKHGLDDVIFSHWENAQEEMRILRHDAMAEFGMNEDEFDDEEEAEVDRDNNEYMVDIGDEEDISDVDAADFSPAMPTPVKAVQGAAPEDVDALMAEIMNMQTMGMSQARLEYSDDMLINMSPERIKRVYSKVMGEALEEDSIEEGTPKQQRQRNHVAQNSHHKSGAGAHTSKKDYQRKTRDNKLQESDVQSLYDVAQDHEVVAKQTGLSTAEVREILDDKAIHEAEVKRLSDLINY